MSPTYLEVSSRKKNTHLIVFIDLGHWQTEIKLFSQNNNTAQN